MKKVHVNQKIQNHQRSLDIEGPQNNPLAFIQLNNFIKAVEMVMNDTKLDPYILTYKLLLTFYSGQELINMTDFKKFFARFEFYFQGNDIRMFLKEIALLQRKEDLIDIKEVASMIRNDVEMLPK